ncbi:metallophosphoesterase family protein [Sphingobacterium sp. UT-1RO-CII-1]|uniref:metallophosphoesterase family protein n=1 Tax=Sphingobacterium sp. UT-1RO-CII-1 TaxID=2995225 RepID=UPI00227C10C1|nr:metallophosphoesterase family protein [Sphingobacterium sp. UT-1RO-CII-1]MCY4778232.1 metallophosphoesterase family protein [Sphingobacterium sp. UT-1RO-CII-1]
MKKIGLISDTHGFIDDRVFMHFDACDEVWHAGDFGDVAIIEQLQSFKPFRGVWGNIDGKEVRAVCLEHDRFMCEELDVWMTHIGGYPGKYAPQVKPGIFINSPKLFICGHSHILKVQFDPKLQLLHLNPGAAGKQGWHQVRTLMRFDINEDKIENLEVIELR